MNIYNVLKQLKKSKAFGCYHGTIVCVVHSKPKWCKDQILLVLLQFRKGIFRIQTLMESDLWASWNLEVILWHKVEEYGLEGNVQSMMQHKKLTSSWFAFNSNLSFIFGDLMCFGVHIYVWKVIVRHLLKLLIKVKCKICRAKALGCGTFSK